MPGIQEEVEAKFTKLSASLKAALTRERLAGDLSRILLQCAGKGANHNPFQPSPCTAMQSWSYGSLKGMMCFPTPRMALETSGV